MLVEYVSDKHHTLEVQTIWKNKKKNSVTVLRDNNPGLNTPKAGSDTSSLKPMLNEPTKLIHDNTTLHHTSETANSNTSNTLIGNNIDNQIMVSILTKIDFKKTTIIFQL